MRHKGHRDKIKVTLNHALHAKLRDTILACLVLYLLLANALKTRIFCKNRNVAVHLAIDLDRLNNALAIALQTTVKVVQLNTRNGTCSPVKELAWQSLTQWVITLALPARNKVKAILKHHFAHCRNLIWRVLKVGIHSKDNLTLSSLKTAIESRTLAVVAHKVYCVQLIAILLLKLLYNLPRAIIRAVIDHYNLIRELFCATYTVNPRHKLRQGLTLIIERYNYRNIQLCSHYSSVSGLLSNNFGSCLTFAAMIRPTIMPHTI